MQNKICPFCNTADISKRVVLKNSLFLAIQPRTKLSKGHTLIITKKHRDNLLSLSTEEGNALFKFIKKVEAHQSKNNKNDGYNIFTNIGPIAGQTVNHFHLHILPRYLNEKISPFTKINKS